MSGPSFRYLVQDQLAPMEEQARVEFKAHMSLCEEEMQLGLFLPGTDRRSKAPISRTLNAFLNTGHGGTVYLGIQDSGVVAGLNLSQFKKDHLMVNLDDLMARYDPPVQKHRYKIGFIPVVPANSSAEEIQRTLAFDSRKGVSKSERQRPHTVRSRQYCWCDKDSMARCNTMSQIPMSYVVEITMKPWDGEDPRNQHDAVGQMRTHPIHQDECGKVYFRRQASVVQCSKQEVLDMSRDSVKEYYQPKIEKLKQQIFNLRSELVGKKPLE